MTQFSALRGAVKARRKISPKTTRALFEKYLRSREDHADIKAAKEADFAKGRDFEDVARELDL